MQSLTVKIINRNNLHILITTGRLLHAGYGLLVHK